MAKQNPQNPPKFVPVSRVLELIWGTILTLQALSCLPQEANGLSCYDCHYSPDHPHVIVGGVPINPKCLAPDEDGAPSKVCDAPADKSCGKEARIYKHENGTISFHLMIRSCTDHKIDPNYESCTTAADFKDSITAGPGKAGHLELKRELKGSAPQFKSRTKRDVVVPVVVTANACFCDKKSNCNNEPGMKATSSAPICLTPPLQLTNLLLLPLLVYSTVCF